MQRITRLLVAAIVATFLALGLSVGIAGAGMQEHPDRPDKGRPGSGVSQSLRQKSHTDQNAHSYAKSTQLIPVNANVPISFLSIDGKDGKDGQGGKGSWGESDRNMYPHPQPRHDDSDVRQTNDASTRSSAHNEAVTVQKAEQDQQVTLEPPKPSDDKPDRGPRGCEEYGPREEHPNGNPGMHHEQPNGDPGMHEEHPNGDPGMHEEHPMKDDGVSQQLSQDAETKQTAESKAASWQIVPINVNAPISVLSSGSNNGDVKQTNDASAESSAKNEAATLQFADQDQQVESTGGNDGAVRQSGDQDSKTEQQASSQAHSAQIVPINANVPISLLSHGSNDGDVHQTNDASTSSHASNRALTIQGASQHQQVG